MIVINAKVPICRYLWLTTCSTYTTLPKVHHLIHVFINAIIPAALLTSIYFSEAWNSSTSLCHIFALALLTPGGIAMPVSFAKLRDGLDLMAVCTRLIYGIPDTIHAFSNLR